MIMMVIIALYRCVTTPLRAGVIIAFYPGTMKVIGRKLLVIISRGLMNHESAHCTQVSMAKRIRYIFRDTYIFKIRNLFREPLI